MEFLHDIYTKAWFSSQTTYVCISFGNNHTKNIWFMSAADFRDFTAIFRELNVHRRHGLKSGAFIRHVLN